MDGKASLLIAFLAGTTSPIAAPAQVRLEGAAGLSGAADMGSRSPRLAVQAVAVLALGTGVHSLGVETGFWGHAGSETMVTLLIMPGDPIPQPPGDTAIGIAATDLGTWNVGVVYRVRPKFLGRQVGLGFGVGGAHTSVTKSLRVFDYMGAHLGTLSTTENAWGGYARIGVVIDVLRLGGNAGLHFGADGAAVSVGEGATSFWRLKVGIHFWPGR